MIDEQPLGRAHTVVFFVLLLTFAIDGVDAQITSYLAPSIAKEWQTSMTNIGLIFSVGLAASAIGALIFGALGDKLGSRRVVIMGSVLTGFALMAMGFANSIAQLATLRFIAGLGIGGCLPNIVSLAAQLAPKARRATVITLVMCGFPAGGALAGALAAGLLAPYGWRAVYIVTGILPLLLVPVLIAYVAESAEALLTRVDGEKKLLHFFRGLYPTLESLKQSGIRLTVVRDKVLASKVPLAAIFQDGRAIFSILISAIFILSLMNLYFLNNWLPTLLQRANTTPLQSIWATTALNVGGIAGTLVFGRLVDLFGFAKALCSSLFCAAICMLMLAQFNFSGVLLISATFVAGFVVQGGQGALYCLPSLIYPDSLRSTATGWATGTGKFGSVVGPYMAGVLLAAGWMSSDVLMLAALAPTLSAILIAVLALKIKSKSE